MELTLRNVSKAFGVCTALRNVSLELHQGVTALLGPNGSGKTTLLRCLATDLQPDSGEINFLGRPYRSNLNFLRRGLGYFPQDLDLPDYLTPYNLLYYLAQLKSLDERQAVEKLIDKMGLGDFADIPCARLSNGQLRLAGIAQAFLGNPFLVVLDEPTRGLDLYERSIVLGKIRELSLRGLVIFSTHNPEDVEQVAERLVVLDAGVVLYSGSLGNLMNSAEGLVYEINVHEAEMVELRQHGCVSRIRHEGDHAVMRVVGGKPLDACNIVGRATLEDIYLMLIHRVQTAA